MKKILFPLLSDLNDSSYDSGSYFQIYRALKKQFEIIPTELLIINRNMFYSGLNYLNRYSLFPWRIATKHSWRTVNGYANQIGRSIKNTEFDGLFATSTLCLAGVKTDKPKFAFADFSFYNALNYHPFASKLISFSRREALAVDKYCFQNHQKIFLASDWAKNNTEKAYGLSEGKILAVGRGANLTSGFNDNELNTIIKNRLSSNCKNLLFVGDNWKRKGGDIAFEIVNKLHNSGFNVTLQIVGCTPDNKRIIKSHLVEVYPFLDTNKSYDLKIFKGLFENAFLFILPTRVEAFGIVFAEAASFGLPSISFKTGGVGSAVNDGTTGFLFEIKENIDTLAMKVEQLIKEDELYRGVSQAAFRKYSEELNWDRIAEKIKNEIEPFL